MLCIVKPVEELNIIQYSKICQALDYSKVEYVGYSESEVSTFDLFNRTNPNKIVVLNSQISKAIEKATKKFEVEVINIDSFEVSKNLLFRAAEENELYKCDECCVQSYGFENVGDLGIRLDNSYKKYFRLYSHFLHAYTCYCGYVLPQNLSTAIKSADSVVCLSETSYHDFKLVNKNTTMADGSTPNEVKSNFDVAYDLCKDSRLLERKIDFDFN